MRGEWRTRSRTSARDRHARESSAAAAGGDAQRQASAAAPRAKRRVAIVRRADGLAALPGDSGIRIMSVLHAMARGRMREKLALRFQAKRNEAARRHGSGDGRREKMELRSTGRYGRGGSVGKTGTES